MGLVECGSGAAWRYAGCLCGLSRGLIRYDFPLPERGALLCPARPKPTATPQEIWDRGSKRLRGPCTMGRWRRSAGEKKAFPLLAQSPIHGLAVSKSPSPVDIRGDLGEPISEHLLHDLNSQRRLRDLLVPVAPRRAPCRRTWIPAGTSFDCRYVTECPSLAFLIACAIFAVDFRPPSRPIRGNTSGVE